MNLKQILSAGTIIQEAIALKNYLHENPELSNREEKTAEFLKGQVRSLGYKVKETENNGFIAVLHTGRPGKTVALRTDMDALPIHEHPENLAGKKEVVSKNEGVMHACGHDAHMAILLASLKLLASMKEVLNGTIIGIFEEGEENGSGIGPMLELLQNESVDAVYGNHVYPALDTGQICVDAGPIMAAYGVFDFTVIGRQGHGSRPDQAVNPIFAGTQILNGISAAWNQEINAEEIVTLGVTKFQSGSTLNIIPDKAAIGGTIRFFNEKEGRKALELIERIAETTAGVHRCSVQFNLLDADSRPVVNDEELAAAARRGIKELFPHALAENVKWLASETFANYARLAPSVFALIGIRNGEKGTGAEVHTEKFEVDDDALKYGIGAMVKFALSLLQKK